MALSASASCVVITPTPTVRSRQIGFSDSSVSYSATPRSTCSQSSSTSACQPSGRSAATPPGRMKLWFIRSPVMRLEQAQRVLALAPAVDHHRHRAEVHAVGGLEQEVRRDAVELDEQHADPHRPLGELEVEEPFDREREHQLVRQRRRVVHARHVGGALHVGELLTGLLHAGVQVADDGLGPQHGLAVELHHDAQHAVGRRVLGPHVEDHRVVDVGPRPARQHELLRTRLAGERTQLLRALVGLRLEAALLGVVARAPGARGGRCRRPRPARRRSSSARSSSRTRIALERDGHARRRVVLAQRVTHPVVGHEDAGEVGVPGELHAEEVVGLALGEVDAPGRGR